MSLKKVVISGLRWTAGARFAAQLVTWSITILVIRLLSPEDYGLMSLATVFVSFLSMLNELGLGASIVQRKNLEDDELERIFGLMVILSVVMFAVMFVISPMLARFYNEPKLIDLFRILALQFLLMPLIVLPQSLLLRKMSFKNVAIVDFLSAIAGSLVTLGFALAGYGVWSLVWGTLAIRIATILGYLKVAPLGILPVFRFQGIFDFFAFGGYVTSSRILWFFYTSVDVLIIGKVLGKEMLGLYSIGLYLATLPMEKVSGIINQVAFPAFSSVQSNPGLAGQHFLKAVRVMSFFAFPALWGISSIAPEIVQVFLGQKWSQSALPLQLIALVIPIRMVNNLMNPAALGTGRADISFYNSLVAFLVMPVAFAVGSYWELLGVCLAWVLVFPLVFLFNLSRVVKLMHIGVMDVLRAMKHAFLAGLAMFAGVRLLKDYVLTDLHSILQLSLLILTGAVLYAVMTFLVNRKGMQEVIGLGRK